MKSEKTSIWPLIIVAFNFTLACPAFAAEPYLEFLGGASHLDYPENEFFAVRGEVAPFARGRNLDTDEGEGIGFNIGGKFGFDLPVVLFDSVPTGVELRIQYDNLEHDSSASFTDPGPGTRFGWVTLDNLTSGFGTPNGATLATETQRNIEHYDADILFRLDIQEFINRPVRVFIGPSFRGLTQRAAIDGRITTGVEVTERLESDYFGGKIGISTTFDLPRGIKATIDAAVSVYESDSRYRGNYSDTAGNTLGPVSVRSDGDTAVGLEAQIKLEKQITDSVTLGGFIGLDYLSYAPQVSYGSLPADPAGGVLSLADDDLLSVFGGMNVLVRF